MANSTSDLSMILPRVLIVSRRCVRKNKFVDFVGEYHLDLIVSYGAVPVIVPRVSGVHLLLDSFEPIHGVLLCEGEDIDPSLYHTSADLSSGLTSQELEDIRRLHVSDTTVDREKDSIELALAKHCLRHSIPYLGICRGSQVLNVAAGGTLYQDVEKELSSVVSHIDYENYDGNRHKVRVVEETPLSAWFKETLDEGMELKVNSYHHQGVKRLAEGFVPMAYAEDRLIEGFYDPKRYEPEEGKFMMGLQFHPERMRRPESDEEFDYPGCPAAYQEFVKAVKAYQKKVNNCGNIKTTTKLDQEMEKRRKILVRSFSLAKNLYSSRHHMQQSEEPVLEVGAEFLEEEREDYNCLVKVVDAVAYAVNQTKYVNLIIVKAATTVEQIKDSNMALSLQQEKRLKQMGATVRNASSYLERLKMNEERKEVVRGVMEKMSPEYLSELLSFYRMMGKVCSEVLEKKLSVS